jgi:hypothetical protein
MWRRLGYRSEGSSSGVVIVGQAMIVLPVYASFMAFGEALRRSGKICAPCGFP